MGKIYKLILDWIRSVNIITEIIWKIKIKKKLFSITYDLTTLALKKCLDKYKKKNIFFENYLDMGCGQIAILGQYQKKISQNSNVTSVDIYQDFIKNSKKNASANNLKIKFIEKRMFNNVKKKYDLITYNPPYVPIRFKKEYDKYEKCSFAGEKGDEEINNFLKKAKKYLSNNGTIFIGVNLFYISFKDLKKIVKSYEYKIIERVNLKPFQNIVLILKKIKS
jgi:methylase of polypeptide subunit release factors